MGFRSGLNWKTAAGCAMAIAALVWVFHDVDLTSVRVRLSNASPLWLGAAVACDVLSYVCEGARWRLLVRTVGDLPLVRAVQAIYAGLFTNEVLPLRAGEFVRAWLAARWTGRPAGDLIPSMAVGRLLDAAWLAAGIAVLLTVMPLPSELERGGEIFAAAIASMTIVFVWLALWPPRWVRSQAGHSRARAASLVRRTLLGIGRIGLSRELALASAFSLALLLLQAAAFWCVMRACGLPLGYPAAAAVFLLVHLGTALPNAPANVGSFQFFTVLGLQLFGIDKSAAAGFSVIVFVVLTLPLWALGLIALSRAGLSIGQIRAALRNRAEPPQRRPLGSSGPVRFRRLHRVPSERQF